MIKSSYSVRISFPVFMIFLNIIFGGKFMRSSNKLIASVLIMMLTLVLISFPVFSEEFFGGNIDWTQFSGQEIRFIMCEHWYTNGLKPIVSEFENKTGIKVIFDIYPEEAFYTKVRVELAGAQPTMDGFMIGSLDMGSYTAANWLEPLNPFFENKNLVDDEWYDFQDLYPSAIDGGTHQGKLLVLPVGAEAEVMAYRKDILEEKGLSVPNTYEELYDAAKKIKTDDMAGYVSRGLRGLSIVWEWSGFLLSYGGRYFDENGNPFFNSPEGIAATDIYTKLLMETGPSGVVNYGWQEVIASAQQGKAGILIEASGALPPLEGDESVVKGKIGYAQIPAGPNQERIPNYWFWNLAMNPYSEKKDATFLFLTWATSKPVFLKIARDSGVSGARLSVWSDSEFFEKQNKEWIDTCIESMSFVKADLIPYLNAKYPEIADSISVELQNVIIGAKSSKEALDESAKQVADLLKK